MTVCGCGRPILYGVCDGCKELENHCLCVWFLHSRWALEEAKR